MSTWKKPRKAALISPFGLAGFWRPLEVALQQALASLDRLLSKTRFWQRHATTVLSERQIKVLNRLLDTATRDLLEKGCFQKLPGGGRNTRYGVEGKDWLG